MLKLRQFVAEINVEARIAKVRVRTPQELVAIGEELSNAYFRGQSSEKWALTSTLERDADQFGVPLDSLLEREMTMLKLFKERVNLYVDRSNMPHNLFEWHALIRHYEGPSRLLDISSSYLVAAYFALSNSVGKDEAVIWAFRDRFIGGSPDPKAKQLLKSSSNSIVAIDSPKTFNDRVNAQSGKFFIPGSFELSLQDQIGIKYETDMSAAPILYRSVKRAVSSSIDHNIWKVTIPHEVQSNLFRFISRCNVRAYSLFPGPKGLAVSLQEMMRVHE